MVGAPEGATCYEAIASTRNLCQTNYFWSYPTTTQEPHVMLDSAMVMSIGAWQRSRRERQCCLRAELGRATECNSKKIVPVLLEDDYACRGEAIRK